jgi:hypothetical protein
MTNPSDETEDLLIHRAVSLTAAPTDWDSLEAMSERDPDVWQRMARALRDEGELTHAVDAKSEIADSIGPFQSRRRGIGFGAASGWFAAAAIAACWFTTLMQTGPVNSPNANRQGTTHESVDGSSVPGLVSNESSPHGIGSPTPVSTLPDILLGTQRAADGNGYEITVMKRSVEKVRVKDLFQMQSGQDELGNPATLPVRFPTTNGTEKY